MTRYSKNRRSWTDEQLVEAVVSSESMAQVMVKLGLKVTAAGNRSTIKKYIAKLNLDTSHWTGQAWVGTREQHPKRFELDDILVENSTYPTSHLRSRLLAENIKPHKCEICELERWQGYPVPLELDHINGVSTDHRLSNLRLLCPNCHAQTPTWRGRKNKSL